MCAAQGLGMGMGMGMRMGVCCSRREGLEARGTSSWCIVVVQLRNRDVNMTYVTVPYAVTVPQETGITGLHVMREPVLPTTFGGEPRSRFST